MWVHHSIALLLLGAVIASASPAWFLNKGFGNTAPSEVGCSSFTKVYDPYTSQFIYRCNPDVKNNYASVSNRKISDKESDEDDYLKLEALKTSGRSRTSYSKPMYQSINSGRSQMKNKNNKPKRPNNSNNKPKRPSNSRRNQCPPGQMFQSELDICIDYPLGPPLQPRRPTITRQPMFDQMLGDALVRVGDARQNAPVRGTAAHQRVPARGTILSVGKYKVKNSCKPNEIYVSSLGICLPMNNCFPYGTTC